MARGIIYVMSTVVTGVLKIGKTETKNFERRMAQLENNGYANVTGLRRVLAIEVSEYDKKEKLIHGIFNKSKVANTELFALDIRDVKSLLSSFDGKLIYPKNKSKEEVFSESILRGDNKEKIEKQENSHLQFSDSSNVNINVEEKVVKKYKNEDNLNHNVKVSLDCVPTGMYYLKRKIKGYGESVDAKALVYNGVITVLKNSKCAPKEHRRSGYTKHSEKVKGSILQEDIEFISPSSASSFVIGNSSNGWDDWKDENGVSISHYRSTYSLAKK